MRKVASAIAACAVAAAIVFGVGLAFAEPRVFRAGGAGLQRDPRDRTGSEAALLVSGNAQTLPIGNDLCDVADSLGVLGGNYFCLRGDGGWVAGMTDGGTAMNLSTVGAPTTQTLTMTPCGADGCAVTGQRLNGTDQAFATGSSAFSGGDQTVCVLESTNAFGVAMQYIAKDVDGANARSFVLQANASGQLLSQTMLNDSTVTSVTATDNPMTAGAVQLLCRSYDFVADNTSKIRLNIDGVESAVNTDTARGPLQEGATPIAVGRRYYAANFDWLAGRVAGALYTEQALSAAQIQALATATGTYAPALLQGSRGEAITFTRASAATCTASDGTVSVLPPGRPCVTGGGYLSEPAGTNKVVWSESVDNAAWVKANGGGASVPSVSANAAVAPDGVTSADRVTWDDASSGARISQFYQGFTATAAPYTLSVWAKKVSGTSTVLRMCISDGTNCVSNSQCALTTSWTRCSLTSGTLSAAPYYAVLGGINAGTPLTPQTDLVGDIWGVQVELGSVATSYVPTGAVAATRVASTAAVANPLAGPNPASWCIGGTVTPTGGVWTGDGDFGGLVTLGTHNAANSADLYFAASTGVFTFIVFDGAGAWKAKALDTGLSAAQHTVYGCDVGGTLSLWVDGTQPAQTGSGVGTGSMASQPATVYLGTAGTNDQANGLLSNVRILNRGTP